MNDRSRHVHKGFKVPSTNPITANELAWIHLLRSVQGEADPPPTLAGVLALGITLINERRPEVRSNARRLAAVPRPG